MLDIFKDLSERGKFWAFILIPALFAFWSLMILFTILLFCNAARAETSMEYQTLWVMNKVFKCNVLPLPIVSCETDIQPLAKGNGRVLGAYYLNKNTINIDPESCWRREEILAHELTHHVQEKCNMPQNEQQAYTIQNAWAQR